MTIVNDSIKPAKITLPPHLAQFIDANGNLTKEAQARVLAGQAERDTDDRWLTTEQLLDKTL